MAPINADRQKLIDAKVQAAVKARIARSEEVKKDSSIKGPGDFSVSIFIDNMDSAEKDYAYKKYAEGLLNTYDSNSDKKITVEEFAKKEIEDANAKSADNQLINKRCGNLLAENLDVNGDGEVSVDEFTYFLKEADTEDDQVNYTQDGVITEKGESSINSQIMGTNVNDENLKAVTEKYLAGNALSAEEQKVLNDGSKAIRAAMSKRSKDYFETDLGEAKDKNVYIESDSAVTAVFEDVTRQSQVFSGSFLGGNTVGTGVYADSTTVNIEGRRKSNNTINFLGNTANAGNYGVSSVVDLGMGFGNVLGYGNTFGMVRTAPAQANTGFSKWWNIGNIFGQGLSIYGMIKGIFGGGGHHCDCYGGLGWWFNRIG